MCAPGIQQIAWFDNFDSSKCFIRLLPITKDFWFTGEEGCISLEAFAQKALFCSFNNWSSFSMLAWRSSEAFCISSNSVIPEESFFTLSLNSFTSLAMVLQFGHGQTPGDSLDLIPTHFSWCHSAQRQPRMKSPPPDFLPLNLQSLTHVIVYFDFFDWGRFVLSLHLPEVMDVCRGGSAASTVAPESLALCTWR